ncbi:MULTISPECIES: hypothetical protein [Okeania]|uniref:Uncharacterized protein n=1 Tax=Okeania hirsuta TaxID=1458930 RepID=A0A3N6NW27_9CYAN|nr:MULTISPECIES: hypothetical protein [Okeania]NET15396.1 hypothetical protein [Okeania sp. SIO1H6]NES79412.1 hypothetical protein [Okeania sp. SIO1H4]NES91812.1 hypothetical protein [Okeania sp. SIO2B9]NET23084.1 hypothetical protein [Okeania sp. SIO1H5]NET80076.1 hypothetical protein [Okeania sp. SIO1F9]
MGRWGDESIFLPARKATRFAIGRRGVSYQIRMISYRIAEESGVRSQESGERKDLNSMNF